MTINEKKSKADLTLKELDIIALYRSLTVLQLGINAFIIILGEISGPTCQKHGDSFLQE